MGEKQLSYHQTYLRHSPYYRGLFTRWGRKLSQAVLESVLKEHGSSLAEYYADGQSSHETADVVAWLGY